MTNFSKKLDRFIEEGAISDKYGYILRHFYDGYIEEITKGGSSKEDAEKHFDTYLDLVAKQIANPHSFELFHKQVRQPFDYHVFGLDFLRPLIDPTDSIALGLNYAEEIDLHIRTGNNVILFANHQIEADPIAINLLLESSYPELAEKMIFVAGMRVITDPLAVPFSLGRNLLCIYSKRYIDLPPELKSEKQLHNKRTMERMVGLLSEGGNCIYVAPSGGRDRPNDEGIVEIAPFDPQSIEMFSLMAQKATRPTFFYSLALKTYTILPPPETIQIELGEVRRTSRGGGKLCFGPKIDMEHYEGSESPDKHERRMLRAELIWKRVVSDYQRLF
jgi:glycerol-3-phosphate O-acyltransferase